MRIIRREYKVTNAIMGQDYHLTPVGAQMLAQDCFAALMASYKVAAFDLSKRSLMWIISEFSMRFNAPMPFWGETVTVELWLSEKPSIKVFVDFRILYRGQEFCSGYIVWAILDIASRKPALAADILAAMECNPELVSGTHRHRQPVMDSPLMEHRHLTNMTDTDFNGHVSNITYMRVCRNSLPAEYISSHRLAQIDMRFLHESFLGDELRCTVYDTALADRWGFVISDGNGTPCCQATALYAPAFTATEDLDKLEIRKC